jgi:sarcosine oxidase subunit beta
MAATIASGVPDPLIRPFGLDRFSRFEQVGERGAASVGH